jgi:hypothetical protein
LYILRPERPSNVRLRFTGINPIVPEGLLVEMASLDVTYDKKLTCN